MDYFPKKLRMFLLIIIVGKNPSMVIWFYLEKNGQFVFHCDIIFLKQCLKGWSISFKWLKWWNKLKLFDGQNINSIEDSLKKIIYD